MEFYKPHMAESRTDITPLEWEKKLIKTPMDGDFKKTQHEFKNLWAFAGLKKDGSVITWGSSENGGDSSVVSTLLTDGVAQIFSSTRAFAAIKDDGSVVTWGHTEYGGDSSRISNKLQSGVQRLFSTESAFAALKTDGSVVTWGDPENGGDSQQVFNDLQSEVVDIYSNRSSFAALKEDGSIVTWGDGDYGGDSSHLSIDDLDGVETIFSGRLSFYARKVDGKLISWGGSDKILGQEIGSKLINIFSDAGGDVAAILSDGAVTAWTENFGIWRVGNFTEFTSVEDQLRSGVVDLAYTDLAFAALKEDGSVVVWGSDSRGGDISNLASTLSSGVKEIFSNAFGFVALKEDGSVVAWGQHDGHRDSPPGFHDVQEELRTGVKSIVPSIYGFAAIKEDGSTVTWGSGMNSSWEDGTITITEELNTDIVDVHTGAVGMAFVKTDGSVLTMRGQLTMPPNTSPPIPELNSGFVSFADPYNDDWLIDYAKGSDESEKLKVKDKNKTSYIDGEGGKDTISGGNLNDTIDGGTNQDLINGGEGNDKLIGGDDDDILIGGTGNDKIDGGDGRDVADYGSSRLPSFLFNEYGQSAIDVNLSYQSGLGIARGEEIGTDILINIESIVTADGNDKIIGNEYNNRLESGGGLDTIYGGAGDDTLIGGLSNDIIDGGDGFDIIELAGSQDNYRIILVNDGIQLEDLTPNRDGVDLISNIESISLLSEQKAVLTKDIVAELYADVDKDDKVNPLTDGLLILLAGHGIESRSALEINPDIVINHLKGDIPRSGISSHIKGIIHFGIADFNFNGMLDEYDAKSFIIQSMGTFPEEILNSEPLNSSSSIELASIEDQKSIVDQIFMQ